jgi:hypothetical protein
MFTFDEKHLAAAVLHPLYPGWPDQKVENQNLPEFCFAKSERKSEGRFLEISENYVNMLAPNTVLTFRSLIHTLFSKIFHFTIKKDITISISFMLIQNK